MFGIIICSHADLCIGLQSSIEMIVGKQNMLVALPFYENTPLEEYSQQIKDQIDKMSPSQCVIVTDLANATPYNCALSQIYQTNHYILSGASLPMMLMLITKRADDQISLEELCNEIVMNSKEFVSKTNSIEFFGEE